MQTQSRVAHRDAPARLEVALAKSGSEVVEAQALRHRVFASELGARLDPAHPGLDVDEFDAYCDHLIVRDGGTQEVVGTYRLLSPEGARAAGQLYSEAEFDLARLAGIRGDLVEAGRSCVHPEHRSGAVIALLWSGIAAYLEQRGYRYVAGCASIGLADGGATAAGIHARLSATHAGPPEWRVFPHVPLPLEALEADGQAKLPPLIKGYIRAGARVCGAPAWDPDFNTADLFMLLSLDCLDPRYASRFFTEGGAPA